MSEASAKERPAAAVDVNAVKTTPYSWFVAMLVFMAYGVSFVARNVWSTAIPVAHETLGITMAAAGGLMTAFYIGYVISNFVTGFVVDMIGPRVTLTLATLFTGIFTFLIPYTPHYAIIFLLRVGAGFASGPLFAGVAKYQISYFSPQTRATAMAVMMAGTRLGTIAATAVFAPIIQNKSWQHGFTYGGLCAIGVAVIFYIFAKEQGAGLQRVVRTSDPAQKAAQAAGLKAVVMNKSFILGTIACFLNIGANQGYTTYLMVFLTRTRGFSLTEAGAILGGTFAVGLVSGPMSGVVADVLKSKKMVCLAGAIVTVILTILLIVANNIAFLIVVLAVRVLLQSLLGTPLNAMQAQAAAGPYVGRAMGIYNGTAQLGSVVFPVVFGLVLDVSGMNFGAIFIIVTATVGVVGFLIMFMTEKVVPKKTAEPARA
jgi:sugar phosphate permease